MGNFICCSIDIYEIVNNDTLDCNFNFVPKKSLFFEDTSIMVFLLYWAFKEHL